MRCPWAGSELMMRYHDEEWGVPAHDDHVLFEFLVLEGAQAGLSWETILRKRDGYRRAFAQFDPRAVAAFDTAAIDALVLDPSIVRHRGKIGAAVANARALLDVAAEFGSFDAFAWAFVDGAPLVNRPKTIDGVPARTELSDRLSTELRKRGFAFVGSTICYSFMQAVGMIDDHLAGCWVAVKGGAGPRRKARRA